MSILKTKKDSEADVTASVELHPGYTLEYYKLQALFDKDPDFEIGELDHSTKSCKVLVQSRHKAQLLEQLLKLNWLTIDIEIPESPATEAELAALLSTNPHFSCLYEAEGMPLKAVMCMPECMHYYSDDAFSPTGHTAVLPQDLIRQLFDDNLNIQTDLTKLN